MNPDQTALKLTLMSWSIFFAIQATENRTVNKSPADWWAYASPNAS